MSRTARLVVTVIEIFLGVLLLLVVVSAFAHNPLAGILVAAIVGVLFWVVGAFLVEIWRE